MSLLLKALENAAKNRESGAPSGDAAAPGETSAGDLRLEPMEASSRAADATIDAIPGRSAAGADTARAQSVLRANDTPARPNPFAWLAERPLIAFSTAAGLFAIGYGVYLYLQLTNPGIFVTTPTTPPPPAGLPVTPPPAPPPPAPVAQAPAPGAGLAPAPGTGMAPTSDPATSTPGAIGLPPAVPLPGQPLPPAGAAGSSPLNAALPVVPPATPAPTAPAAVPPVAPAATAPAPAARVTTPPAAPTPSAAPAKPVAPAVGARAPTPVAPAPAAETGVIAPRAAPTSTPRTVKPSAPEGVAPPQGPQLVPVSASLLAAYDNLDRGHFQEAERLYRQTLAQNPSSIDAMLGLAVALVQQGKADAAGPLYLRVLELEPRNPHAQAGLLALGGRADPQAAEARLKQLIAREPSAFLYFTLGNLYAEQALWPAAQSAYFQAHALAPDNPDFAFNLAIGLEHLSQPAIALTYYRRAVQLAETRGHARFDLATAQQRIRSLEAGLTGQP